MSQSGENDRFAYKSLTKEYLDGALIVMEKGFYPREICCRCMKLYLDREAMDEMNKLSAEIAKDGVSLIAVERATDRVAGVAFNKILQDSGDNFFQNFPCRTTLGKAVIEKIIKMDNSCDIFKLANAHTTLEILFLATLPEFDHNGIGGKLVSRTCDLVQELRSGVNVKRFSEEELDLEPVPEVISTICTSPFTEKIAVKRGFKIGSKMDPIAATYNGGPLDELPGVKITHVSVVYKKF